MGKIIFIGFVVYAAASFISDQAAISEQKDKLDNINAKAQELQYENEEYQRLLSVDENEYMSRIAMEKLGYAYPFEIRFYDKSRN
ncbi:MAG: hypothetical protein RR540_06755 [Oscillospiraceae bacterium]